MALTQFIPSRPPRRPRPKPGGSTPTPTPTPTPTALALVSATYASGTSLTLVFDRAVDAAGMDGNVIAVNDQPGTGLRYTAIGAVSRPDPLTVVVGLVETGTPASADVTLDATPDTDIVAVDDGGTWPGGYSILLPFP